jgi:hypothetical protein
MMTIIVRYEGEEVIGFTVLHAGKRLKKRRGSYGASFLSGLGATGSAWLTEREHAGAQRTKISELADASQWRTALLVRCSGQTRMDGAIRQGG